MRSRILTLVRRAAGDPRPDADLLTRLDDHETFAELVSRHGPMVWGVCRHTLGEADAEDAFQATFVALLRSNIRDGASLAAWLHGVAVRVSLAARRQAGRRRARERAVAAPEIIEPQDDWADTMAAVHREVSRLPAHDRSAFVLCVLEGLTQAEAAARLGRSLGIVAGQVARAKKRLVERLTGRGVVPGLALLGPATVAAAVPPRLVNRVTTGAVPPAVLQLAKGAVGMTGVKLMAAAVLMGPVLAAGILSASGPSPVNPLPAIAAEAAPDGKTAAGLETLFHGEWQGGDCVGKLTLKADGTYHRKHWTPGNNTAAGRWSVRWDVLPPTLVMKCEASDDKDHIGKSWEMRVTRLDAGVLEYRFEKESLRKYERVMPEKDSALMRGMWRVVKEEHRDGEKWVEVPRRDATFSFKDGHVTVANTGIHPRYRLTLDEGKKTLVMQSDNPSGFLLLYHGRYRLDGDGLTICLGDKLPDDFTPKAPASLVYRLARVTVDLRDADGKVIIAADEITAYEWATHSFTLTPAAAARLRTLLRDERRLDKPFAVAVGGKTAYTGQFTTVISSRRLTGVVVLVDGPRDDARFRIGYSLDPAVKADDPRINDAIKAVLKATGKFK